jgi:hypothetical protein
MYKNKSIVIGVDNFSEASSYGNSKDELLHNVNKYQGENEFKFIDLDCYSIDITTIGKFNMFLYDGDHSYEAHNKALKYFYNCLDDIFIFIIDDWNWYEPRNATLDSIKELGLNILWEKQIFTTDNLIDKIFLPGDIIGKTWWNGIGIFLLQKEK